MGREKGVGALELVVGPMGVGRRLVARASNRIVSISDIGSRAFII